MQPVATKTRTYNSTRRSRQAAQTRAEILTAAIELFTESGWAGTTLAAIAERASVAVETIYSGFGSKKGLLRAAFDVAVVGDAEEVPLAQRPESIRLGEGKLEDRVRAGAVLTAEVHERSIGVWRAFVEAARADEELEAVRVELERARRVEIANSIARILDRKVDGRHLDLLWAILGPDVYGKLVLEAGLSRADYETCMVETLMSLRKVL
jgi:AcrR family transcriptional regulator